MSIPHHSRDVEVLDHENLASVHKGLGCLMNEMSSGIRDSAMSLGESEPRSLATLGPRCGSGQGLVGRLERRLRLLQCFHPLEALEGNAVDVGGDAERGDPPVDSDGNDVTVGATALRLMEFGGYAGEGHDPTSAALSQRR